MGLEATGLDNRLRVLEHLREVKTPTPVRPLRFVGDPIRGGKTLQGQRLEIQLTCCFVNAQLLHDFLGITHSTSIGDGNPVRTELVEETYYVGQRVGVGGAGKDIGAVEIGFDDHRDPFDCGKADLFHCFSNGRVPALSIDLHQADLCVVRCRPTQFAGSRSG